MNVRTEDTILPGALEPKPCSLRGTPVYSEHQQTLSDELYSKTICYNCEHSYLWGMF